MSENNILLFLKELKDSDELMGAIFTKGSCFRLCRILQVIFPEAEALYSETDGHWVTKINQRYFDINGEIQESYILGMDYRKREDCEESAYVPTYSGQCSSYSKYKKTVK